MNNKVSFLFNGKQCEGILIGYPSCSDDYSLTDWEEFTVYYEHKLLNVHIDKEYAPIISYDEYTGEPIYGEPTEEYTVELLYDNVVIPLLDESLKEEIIKDLDWD